MTLMLDNGLQGTAADDSLDSGSAERRRGLRVCQSRPVKVLGSISGKYFGGQTQDISATGLRIELPAYAVVRMGEMVCVHVGLNVNGEMLANRRQMIPARVVWVRRGEFHHNAMIAAPTIAGVEFSASIGAQLDAA